MLQMRRVHPHQAARPDTSHTALWLSKLHKERGDPLRLTRPLFLSQQGSLFSNPSFRHSVLPGRFAAGALGFQTDGAQRAQNPGIELSIPIQDRVSIGDRIGKCFAQLLDYPVRIQVSGDVEMQNPAPCMLDDEQAIQHTRKFTVGTVKKSIATMASRWFRRKASQRFPGSPCRWTARLL